MKQEDVCAKVCNDDSVVSQECVFKKGGWCLIHKRFGEKVLLRSRKWTKLGTGLCGYKLSKKVSWRCGGLSLNDVDNSDSTVSDSLEFSGSRGNRAVDIGSCFDDNLSVRREGLCVKRTADVSLEPRTACKQLRYEGV